MTEPLPPGWALADVGSISHTQLGKTLNRSKQTRDESLKYLRNINIRWGGFDLTDLKSMDIPPEEFEQFTVREGDLLLTEGGEPGRCAVWNFKEILGFQNALHRVRPVSNISPYFLRYQFEWLTKAEKLSHLFSGVTIKHFSQSKLRSVTIRIAPIPEQARIVAAIEDHFSRINAAESAAQTALARLDTLRRAILTAAFSGYLVNQDPDDEPASVLLERIADERLQRRTRQAAQSANKDPSSMTEVLPPGWAWANFGSIARTQLGKMLSEKSKTGISSRPYLRNKNVQWHRFDLRDIAQMDFTDKDQTKYGLQPGDLLVCEGGEVGRCATWLHPAGEMYFQKALHRVRPHHPIQVKWLEYFLRWSAETDRFAQHTSGSTINHLPQRDLRQLYVPIPPSSEQKLIVAAIEEQFSRIDAAKASLERCLRRCNAMRRSVLTTAFSGRLVEQNPNDEPASALLQRIAVEQPKRRPRRKSA